MTRCIVGMMASALTVASGLAADAGEPARPVRVLVTTGGHGFEEEPFYRMLSELPGIVRRLLAQDPPP